MYVEKSGVQTAENRFKSGMYSSGLFHAKYPDSKIEIKVNVYSDDEYRYFKEIGC